MSRQEKPNFDNTQDGSEHAGFSSSENENFGQDMIAYYQDLDADFLTVTSLSPEQLHTPIKLQGTIRNVRRQGGIAFIELSGTDPNTQLQVVVTVPKGEIRESFDSLGLKKGSIIRVQGQLDRRPSHAIIDDPQTNSFAEYEFQADAQTIESIFQPEKIASALPWKDLVESGNLTKEFYGEILRMPEFMRIQRLREDVSRAFVEYFTGEGFVEVIVPALTQSVAESGAEVFRVRGRAGELALNQSPQQVKQIMAGIYGQVVCRGQFFRDDPSFTPHHLAEFTGLDAEMQIRFENKWQAMGDVMHQLEGAIKAMIEAMEKHPKTLSENDAELPVIPEQGIPIVSLEDAMTIVRKVDPEIKDFNRKAEGIVASFIKNRTESDFYFVIGFSADEKPFYTDIVGDGSTYSFDLVYRGVEISSGGLRIADPNLLRQRLTDKGFTNFEQFADYLDNFERGSAQTGGFGLGLERFLANSLGGLNVRLTTIFPKTAKTALG